VGVVEQALVGVGVVEQVGVVEVEQEVVVVVAVELELAPDVAKDAEQHYLVLVLEEGQGKATPLEQLEAGNLATLELPWAVP
jgi:hypothetical protein